MENATNNLLEIFLWVLNVDQQTYIISQSQSVPLKERTWQSARCLYAFLNLQASQFLDGYTVFFRLHHPCPRSTQNGGDARLGHSTEKNV